MQYNCPVLKTFNIQVCLRPDVKRPSVLANFSDRGKLENRSCQLCNSQKIQDEIHFDILNYGLKYKTLSNRKTHFKHLMTMKHVITQCKLSGNSLKQYCTHRRNSIITVIFVVI